MLVPRRAGQGRVQHLRHLGPVDQPLRHLARSHIVRGVPQGHAGQAAQHHLDVIEPNPDAQPHVRELQAQVQGLVARDDGAHEHVATA
ncbi:hypothetical protein NGUA31_03840 [Salmonella enterica]|nr:hypothetical protein NGUA31_03840 [Salmonella enterica]